MLFLSDSQGLACPRICADDFGSALKHLETIKKQFSVFKLASQVSGLDLKPEKCVISVSIVEHIKLVENAIREWLRVNVFEFASFLIQRSGEYFGWILGRDSINLSFKEPVCKFVNRVEEVVSGSAPATSAILR